MSNNTETNKCIVCKNADSSQMSFHLVEEMMFGMGESFKYMFCKICGLLQITSRQDMSKYYPQSRYSSLQPTNKTSLKNMIRKQANKDYVFNVKTITTLLTRLWSVNFGALSMFRELPELPHENILDVGCGTGYFLDRLYEIGFRDLHGVDLFIGSDLHTNCGIKVMKGEIHDVNKQFKLIMLNHSFEHMWDQLLVLEKIRSLLLPDGICAIRMPVINEAWNIYKENWYQIDAPRHFFLHTEKSFIILADKAGFEVTKIFYDSTSRQFIASELYRKGIPLKKQTKRVIMHQVGAKQLKHWRQEAVKFNATHKGDQAVFILRSTD